MKKPAAAGLVKRPAAADTDGLEAPGPLEPEDGDKPEEVVPKHVTE